MLRRCAPRNDTERNNIAFKGLDVVRQYASKFFKTAESGVDKVGSSCEKNPVIWDWNFNSIILLKIKTNLLYCLPKIYYLF